MAVTPLDILHGILSPTALILFLVTYVAYAFIDYAARRRRMPPGPLGLPWVGNRHQVPSIKPWRQFAKWNRQYGSVVSLFLGRTPVLVLGTAQAAWDLLEKRSDIYSSRPRFIMAGEILSDNKRGLMMPAGENWRKFRKVYHSGFHSRRADTYRDVQSLESKLLMYQLLHEPKDFEKHIQRYAASVIVSVVYGKRVDSVDEWIVKENMAAMGYMTSLNIPGKYIVESWPWLLKLPRSLQWFRHMPERRRQRDIKLLTHLLQDVQTRIETGTCPPCLAADALEDQEKMGIDELQVAYTVSSPFGAGIETTSGSLLVFVQFLLVAMLHHPDTMRRAQAELDAVIGQDRMPDWADDDSLPYVRAVINEVMRWRPVAALGGAPHASTVDDEYNGMFIPKGTTVFANLDGIMRDPETFPNPEAFLPSRWLSGSALCSTNPRLQLYTFDLPFGFGRRICPGQHLASNSVFINIARMLWAFEFEPVSKGVLPDPWEFTNGSNSWPKSFECRMQVRSERIGECIEREWEGAKEGLGRWQ
ncbi:hypothetical protein EWM64_g4512 [Hericium alpestre]|uniref:Cytochrome P450 n=1 Tax=Hericium alpestre TaxID=135208 RepID=A0A4Y9ZZJ2_9AGAM|nr:hypothetical protein EWM64_g4512 [Hericium alpestre]